MAWDAGLRGDHLILRSYRRLSKPAIRSALFEVPWLSEACGIFAIYVPGQESASQ